MEIKFNSRDEFLAWIKENVEVCFYTEKSDEGAEHISYNEVVELKIKGESKAFSEDRRWIFEETDSDYDYYT